MKKPTILSAYLVSMDHAPVKGVKEISIWTIGDLEVLLNAIEYKLSRYSGHGGLITDTEVCLRRMKNEIGYTLKATRFARRQIDPQDDELPF